MRGIKIIFIALEIGALIGVSHLTIKKEGNDEA
jgi:hypothetical protein